VGLVESSCNGSWIGETNFENYSSLVCVFLILVLRELTQAENTSAWANSRSTIWQEWAKTDGRRAVTPIFAEKLFFYVSFKFLISPLLGLHNQIIFSQFWIL